MNAGKWALLALGCVWTAQAAPALADTLIDNVRGISFDTEGRAERFTGLVIGQDGRIAQVLGLYDARPARPRVEPAQVLDAAEQQAAGEDDEQRLSDARCAAVEQVEQRPVAAGKRPFAVLVENPAGGQVDLRKTDEEHRQQRKNDAGDAKLNSP